MSGDDELEGENETSLFEHFAPVGRSIERTVTNRSIQAYTVSFVGVVILSASLGGVILGPYAAIQPAYGLCNDPVLDVYPAEHTNDLTDGPDSPTFVRFSYGELSAEERRTFRAALASATDDAKLGGRTEHIDAFHDGAIVTYRGEDHYTVLETTNDCVPTGRFNVPLSVVGLVVGAGLFVGPGLWGRFR